MPDAPVTEDDASVYRCVAGFRVDSRVGNGAADGLEHCCLVLEVFEISDTRWSVSAPGAVFGVDAASRSAASRSTRTVSSSPLTSASTASSTRPNTASASPYLTRAILPIPPKTADAAPDRISAAVPVPLGHEHRDRPSAQGSEATTHESQSKATRKHNLAQLRCRPSYRVHETKLLPHLDRIKAAPWPRSDSSSARAAKLRTRGHALGQR